MKHALVTVLLLANALLGEVMAAPFEVGDRVDAAIHGEWLAVQGGGFKISAARYVKR